MNRTEENLDNLLGAFFRAETPNPWPGPPARTRSKLVPAPAPGHHAGTWAASSKYALAASLGLLLAGGWLLSGKLGTPSLPSLPSFEMGKGGASRLPLPMPGKGKDKPVTPDDMVLPPGQ